ncbi:hypothetical protein AUJ16_03925 [Candidatus Micrarchaeota archaeon CG1_02_60_51]|nr:MAG: hypothetical protein AUJ16_03925 [Candidatus Micrarchaeota archaeon CG1_02_60_51]PIO01897.1 MAG: hypothetical protein COT58_02745 [Candidatus Micrarchaeota archaeon CG09_land_8_20_14_0_10_60_16]
MLEEAAHWLAYSVLGLNEPLAGAAEFFFYDSVKVLLLLAGMVFLVGLLRTFVTQRLVKRTLGGKREGWGNVLAALLGVPTPFCSCSAVPLFIGFLEAGVPLGVTFSFLIASPMINEVAIALLWGLFGWQVAALYVATGLVIAVAAGMIIGRLRLEGQVKRLARRGGCACERERRMDWKRRFAFAWEECRRITASVAPYLFIGIAIGAFIHGFVPVGALADWAGRGNPLAVPVAVAIGVPLYSNAAGVLPIVQALTEKGVAMGTALAFMMSVTALSFPEMVILSRVLKPRLLAAFIAILAFSFVLTGLLFNAVLG